MARVIRAAALGRAPRLLYPDVAVLRPPAPDALPAPAAPAHVCADPRLVADLQLQVATLETQLAEHQLRLETWQVEEAARVEQAYREAAERGQAEGRGQAAAEGRAALHQQGEQVRRVLDALQRQVTERASECEDALVGIAFSAVCKLLGERAADAEGIRTLIRQACTELDERDMLSVRLHPDDMALLNTPSDTTPNGIVLVPDAIVGIGGCMIDSASGTLDARLETQLAELATVLCATRAARRATGNKMP